MEYKEALSYISRVPWVGCKPGLIRITELLSFMGKPQESLKFVHIAGTNGKGSTAAMLEAVFIEAGHRTGLFTSPHLYRFNERIRVDGTQISDEEVAEVTEYVRKFADQMTEPGTEFEIITAMAFEYFKRKKCDIVILEVGMGGTLDCTNVIEAPEAAVITAIAMDHTAELGDTLEKVAMAKAGIIKPFCDVVAYGGSAEVESVFRGICRQKQAVLHPVDMSGLCPGKVNLDHQCFTYEGYPPLSIPLVGTYQIKNAAVVLTAINVLRKKGWDLSVEVVAEGLKKTVWPCRFELLLRNPVFIVDGAHNPHGIRATAKSLKEHFRERKIVFLLGVLKDKEFGDMLHVISPLASEFITLTPDSPRAMKAEELASYIEELGFPAFACASVTDGIEEAIRHAGTEGIVCSLGSLYLAGEVRAYMKNRTPDQVF